jgi:hypothetical protein
VLASSSHSEITKPVPGIASAQALNDNGGCRQLVHRTCCQRDCEALHLVTHSYTIMFPVVFTIAGQNLDDLPGLQQKFTSAVEHIAALQHSVPDEAPGPELLHAATGESSAEDRPSNFEQDLEQEQLQAKLHGANEHIAILQSQLAEKDHQIILLQQQLQDVCRFQRKMTLNVFREDRVADLLNKELKLSRIKAHKLSEELLVACQSLQESHSNTEELSSELLAANESAAKLQRQVAALKKLVVSKVTHLRPPQQGSRQGQSVHAPARQQLNTSSCSAHHTRFLAVQCTRARCWPLEMHPCRK